MKNILRNTNFLYAVIHCSTLLCAASASSANQRQSVNEYDEESSPGKQRAEGRIGRFPSLGDQVGFGPPIGFPTFNEPLQHSSQEHSQEDHPSQGGIYSGPQAEASYEHGTRGGFQRPHFSEYPQGRPEYPQGRPEYPPQGHPQSYPQGPQRSPSHSHPTYPKRPYHHSDPKKPIVLKVSRLKNSQNPRNSNYQQSHPRQQSTTDDGPSVFYAPSPDVKYKKDSSTRQSPRHPYYRAQSTRQRPTFHNQNENNYNGEGEEYPSEQFRGPPPHQRYRRETEVSKKLTKADDTKADAKAESLVDPMLADGSEQDNFWDLTSPFIMFDTYKKDHEEEDEAETSDVSSNQSSGNVSFHDSNSEEQRFFPSFPSPYLGLSPFSSAPARAPLFPGLTANRAPSRYHPSSFGGPNKYSQHPNRGPSTVAASHERYQDTNLLGSGNFEVVRGGTYYGDEDDHGPSYHHGGGGGGGVAAARPSYHEDDEGYYHHNNGHTSPYRGGGGDFFANFRDFADINPHSRSYSHNHETHGAASELSAQKKVSNGLVDMSEESRHHNQPQFSMEYDPMMATF